MSGLRGRAVFVATDGPLYDLWVDGRVVDVDVPERSFADSLHRARVPKAVPVAVQPSNAPEYKYQHR